MKYIQADGGNIVEQSIPTKQVLSYTYNIVNLRPGRTYSVEVYAIINNIKGDSVSFNQTTKPSPVASFSGTVIGPTSVDLTWEPNAQSVQESYELNYMSQINRTSWTTATKRTDASTTIDKLFPGDKYTFQIVAVSNDQKSEAKQVNKVTRPNPPQMFCESIGDSEIKLKLRRGAGVVHEYHVECEGPGCPSTVTLTNITDLITEHSYKNLTPHTGYTFKVKSEVQYGSILLMSMEGQRDCLTSQLAPWIDQSLYEQSKPKVIKVTHNSVDVELFNPFTSKNGEITGYSVIVCNNPKQINQLDDVTGEWETAIEDNPISPYAAIYQCLDLFLVGNVCWDVSGRRKRATEDRVVVRVGGDEKCDSKSDYCNGPLKPDQPYYILLRAYTENGLFSDSPLSDPVITDKKPAEEDREQSQEQSGLPGAAIGGIVASAILATILIAIIVVVVMRCRGSCQKETEPPPSGEGDNEYYNTGQDKHKQKVLPREPQPEPNVYEMPARESTTYETIDDKQYSQLTFDLYEN